MTFVLELERLFVLNRYVVVRLYASGSKESQTMAQGSTMHAALTRHSGSSHRKPHCPIGQYFHVHQS